MPVSRSKVKGQISKVKNLLIAYCLLLIALTLSGCSIVGTSKPAALQVTSTPEASVFLDGKHLGKTPFYSDQLRAGEYTLKVTVSEASYVDKISLTAGTLTVVNRELANNFLAQSGEKLWLTESRKGLFIISSPTEADVTIDGKFVGKTPVYLEGITEGDHKVLLAKLGFLQREFAIKTSAEYQLFADVTLASEIAKGIVKSPPPSPPVKKVEIASTPQGFLRVRKEPSLSSPEVGRVKTGDQLEIIQETGDWIKISFEDLPAGEAGKLGWISSQYAKKL